MHEHAWSCPGSAPATLHTIKHSCCDSCTQWPCMPCRPPQAILRQWPRREKDLQARHKACNRSRVPVSLPLEFNGARSDQWAAAGEHKCCSLHSKQALLLRAVCVMCQTAPQLAAVLCMHAAQAREPTGHQGRGADADEACLVPGVFMNLSLSVSVSDKHLCLGQSRSHQCHLQPGHITHAVPGR